MTKRRLMSVLAAVRTLACALGVVAMTGCASSPRGTNGTGAIPASVHHANDVVLAHAFAIEDGGGYVWESTGVSETITHKGETILRATDDGTTYCCGYTFMVAMRACDELGLLEQATPADVRRMQTMWYGSTPASAETQMALAMSTLGIGGPVTHDQAIPGDFVQLWRHSGSGHSTIFLGWARDESGAIKGLRYRSSQGSTDGVADNVEMFGEGGVDRARTYFARLGK